MKMKVNYAGWSCKHCMKLTPVLLWLCISLHLRMHHLPFVDGELWREYKIVL
jgi:hypothetical protein